jgi:bifunctional DNA-binding transcriptional regulator/antitoxin component of YhaV-PrlF toxin-antitoxin module
MEIMRLSGKGRITLPERILGSRGWGEGTEFAVEECTKGILLRPVRRFPETRLEDVAGCLRVGGRVWSEPQN